MSVYLECVCVCGRVRGGSGMRTLLSSGQSAPLSIPLSERGRGGGGQEECVCVCDGVTTDVLSPSEASCLMVTVERVR